MLPIPEYWEIGLVRPFFAEGDLAIDRVQISFRCWHEGDSAASDSIDRFEHISDVHIGGALVQFVHELRLGGADGPGRLARFLR